jgi:hypothetical protein
MKKAKQYPRYFLRSIEMPETITRVAIKYEGKTWTLPAPNRHHHIIRMIADSNGIGIDGEDEQGFMTDTGRFVNRVEALKIALDANQVLDINNIRAKRLFSEDLW